MKDISAIIFTIDDYLERNSKVSIGAVEANKILEKEGILADSATRKGLPLRKLLREGLLPHAYQTKGKNTEWIIPHSKISNDPNLSIKIAEDNDNSEDTSDLLTNIFDSHLISSGKNEMPLRTANEILKLDERFREFDLKKFLENGLLPQAYQTEIKPKLWYIKFSNFDKYIECRQDYLSKSELKQKANNNSKISDISSSAKSIIISIFILFLLIAYCNSNEFDTSQKKVETVQNSPWDESVFQVRNYLKANYLKDPDSYQEIEWSDVQIINNEPNYKYIVRHKFRAKNSFGGYVIEDKIFYLDSDGNVIDFIDY